MQKLLGNVPQKQARTRGPHNIRNIHPLPVGGLQEGDTFLHGPNHGHDSLIAHINNGDPILDFSWN
jgi:hypothetical protein